MLILELHSSVAQNSRTKLRCYLVPGIGQPRRRGDYVNVLHVCMHEVLSLFPTNFGESMILLENYYEMVGLIPVFLSDGPTKVALFMSIQILQAVCIAANLYALLLWSFIIRFCCVFYFGLVLRFFLDILMYLRSGLGCWQSSHANSYSCLYLFLYTTVYL